MVLNVRRACHFPSRRVRWSLLSTFVLTPVDFSPEDPDFVPEDYE